MLYTRTENSLASNLSETQTTFSSHLIADGLGVEHKTLMALIREHEDELTEYGPVERLKRSVRLNAVQAIGLTQFLQEPGPDTDKLGAFMLYETVNAEARRELSYMWRNVVTGSMTGRLSWEQAQSNYRILVSEFATSYSQEELADIEATAKRSKSLRLFLSREHSHDYAVALSSQTYRRYGLGFIAESLGDVATDDLLHIFNEYQENLSLYGGLDETGGVNPIQAIAIVGFLPSTAYNDWYKAVLSWLLDMGLDSDVTENIYWIGGNEKRQITIQQRSRVAEVCQIMHDLLFAHVAHPYSLDLVLDRKAKEDGLSEDDPDYAAELQDIETMQAILAAHPTIQDGYHERRRLLAEASRREMMALLQQTKVERVAEVA